MENTINHQEEYRIRSSEVNSNGRARLQSVCELLQEIAGNHALKLNFDISQLREENLTWILHRLHIRMDRYPEWRETIAIRTWPSSGDTLRAYRDFLVLDEKGNEIGRALSYWLMLNTDTRRPVRMPKKILAMAPADIDHVMNIKTSRLTPPPEPEAVRQFSVRRSDLDLNRHVNNARYIDWALEALPEDRPVEEFDIEFQAECTYGDTILSELTARKAAPGYIHRIRRERDGKTAALAQSRFTPA